MKTTKLILTLAAPVLAFWAVRSKIRSEHIDNASPAATFVKIVFRPLIKKAAYRSLQGRYIDRQELTKGRFTSRDVDRILEETWRHYDKLAPLAHVEELKTHGNRLMVLVSVETLAFYHALLVEGVEKGYATELAADLLWASIDSIIPFYRSLARLLTHDSEKQMEIMVNMLLRLQWNHPGYEYKISQENGVIALDFYRCPVYDFYKKLGEEEVMLNTACKIDFALAQVMTKGGYYEREHTLSVGDKVCDQRWSGVPKRAAAF
jgi:hypothetical protein